MSDSLNERIGAAIGRATAELPDHYSISVELDKGKSNILLFIPPVSDEQSGEMIDEFSGNDFAEKLENAINYAIEHNIDSKE